MRKIVKIEAALPQLPKKKQVAAYARVSVETERLNHSLSAQISFYSALIQSNPEWEYVGVYADSFVSGTSTKHRTEFQRMIADAEHGKIDIILCKSISRFARNTVDLLETVRHLKELGVEVRFEKENIHSLSGDGELMLSVLASFAEEESRSISDNSKWGIRKRFQSGEIGTANKHILGYRYDENLQKYVIIPEEAAIVRRMFALYLEGVSLQKICDDLNESGYRTVHGCLFRETSLMIMIRNEVYAGDILRQKSFMADPITKNKVKNQGEFPKYYMPDTHEAIIDRETYAKVQEEIARRSSLLNPTYCFTGKLKCEICGMPYTRKISYNHGKKYVHWICRAKKKKGMHCSSINFTETKLEEICTDVLETDGFSEELFNQQVLCMTVLENGDIAFQLAGNQQKIWKNPHITEAKHVFTVTDCFQNKIRCACCGNPYHRVVSAGKWCYWYCIGKRKNGVSCRNRNFADYQLCRISAQIMGISSFSEREFESQIEKITVTENGDLRYQFQGGSEKLWQM